MRKILILLGTTSLAACSGGGPTTVGGSAAVGGGTTPTSTHTFVNPTEAKTYQAIGGTQHYNFSTQPAFDVQYAQLYRGDANTARDTAYSITYNPRDAIFDLTFKATKSEVDYTGRFQDPVHRTNFGGAQQPQAGVPDLTAKGMLYLEAGSASGNFNSDGYTSDVGTFFYQKPGTTTKYVTYAGYLRNKVNQVQVSPQGGTAYLETRYDRTRGTFVFGEKTANGSVPKTGTGTFTGEMLATMVYNPLLDIDASTPTFFQWLDGTSTTTVDFAANTFTLGLVGTVHAPQLDFRTSPIAAMPAGATFNASGSGKIDLVNAGGFLGNFGTAYFTNGGVRSDVVIAGSSIDGAFYGPTGQEVGGGFRIVGGTPDQRIDILGVFTGAR